MSALIIYGFDDDEQEIVMPNYEIVDTDGNIEDKPTPEGYAELDAAIARMSKINRAKLRLFADMTVKLAIYCSELPAMTKVNGAQKILEQAQKLLRDEFT